ncbi:hypothetical protein [Conyzicola sp.]|uniref:hypothetical protein n=1 Tax=Conyzicola sp. TaxID=1969404 RepID=UPI003988F6AC
MTRKQTIAALKSIPPLLSVGLCAAAVGLAALAALACGAVAEIATFIFGDRAVPDDGGIGITTVVAFLAIGALFVFEAIAAWLIARAPRIQPEKMGAKAPSASDATAATAFAIIVAGFAAILFASITGLIVQPGISSTEGLLIAVTTVLAGIPFFFVVLPVAIPEPHVVAGALLVESTDLPTTAERR